MTIWKFLKIYSNVLPRESMWQTVVTDGHDNVLGEKNNLLFPYQARSLTLTRIVQDSNDELPVGWK